MDSVSSELLATLRAFAKAAAERSWVPYSERQEAVVLLLSDGGWIPGVRVESMSFSLTISSLLNAVTTAVAARRTDVVAVVSSRPFLPEELMFASGSEFLHMLEETAPDVLSTAATRLPNTAEVLSPFVDTSELTFESDRTPTSDDVVRGIQIARSIATRAHVPESDFPVGCVIDVDDGAFVPGVNVEHRDWSQILCAERNALGTCVSYGLRDIATIYLTCLDEPEGTSCGACRQLLVELAPTAMLWMDRGIHPPAASNPLTLLPGSFKSERLAKET